MIVCFPASSSTPPMLLEFRDLPPGMGMSPRLDPLTFRFAAWAGYHEQPCADIGCGAGLATAAALARGARVHAIDPDVSAVRSLLNQLSVQEYARADFREGSLPNLHFESSSLGSIHVARVFHLLDGACLRKSVQSFRDWLIPGGKLFISVLTPHGDYWSLFRSEYDRRCAEGEAWPGLAEIRGSDRRSRRAHLIDERVLQRELTAAGFRIEELFCFPLSWDPSQICCGVVAASD
jgi:SAM-dependent methyltransferase